MGLLTNILNLFIKLSLHTTVISPNILLSAFSQSSLHSLFLLYIVALVLVQTCHTTHRIPTGNRGAVTASGTATLPCRVMEHAQDSRLSSECAWHGLTSTRN